jgi:ubiquinone/menaquinone biosynthesis C-methylase UbiE
MEPKLQRWVQRQGWDRASSHYDRYWRRQLRPAVDLLTGTAALAPGEDVLDVAAGTGAVALHAARAIAPGGRVLATDIAPKMLDELSRRAAACGLDNLDVEACGAEDLASHEEFDVALCSLGLMYVPSPTAAAVALQRAVKPGGRVVVSVWGDRRNCGWADIFPIVDARVSSDVCPMFFALGAEGALTDTLATAGFVDVEETRLSVELAYPDADTALGAAFIGGPVALAVSRFAPDVLAEAHEEYLTSIAPYADGDGYRLPGEFVVASARRAD